VKIKFYLAIKNTPSTVKIENGIVATVEMDYGDNSPMDGNGKMKNDLLVYKHLLEVRDRLVEEFMTVKFDYVYDDQVSTVGQTIKWADD